MNEWRFKLKPFAAGQVWEVAKTSLKISLVGKTLVQYKRYTLQPRGVPTSFSNTKDLEKFLTVNKAILVKE